MGTQPAACRAVLSYDEKLAIQAIENTAPDLPPVPGKHSAIGRDLEYIRHGTLSLLAGIDALARLSARCEDGIEGQSSSNYYY